MSQHSTTRSGHARRSAQLPHQPRQELAGVDADSFAHPFDREAISTLRRLKGFDYAVGKVIEWQHERAAHVLHTSSGIRIGPRQLPRLHALLAEACTTLGMDAPELYVAHGPVNAYTSGHNNPYIVLNSDLVEVMDDAEVQAVIGHELGHIKCKHVLYKEMVTWIGEAGLRAANASSSRQSALVAVGVKLALRHMASAMTTWDQKSELSADRAAMLVVQDEATCIRMLIKLAGAPARLTDELDVDAFLDQAHHLQALTLQSTIADRARRQMSTASSHPLLVERAMHLDAWIQSGGYADLMADLRAAHGPLTA